jgi:hypothetical protein
MIDYETVNGTDPFPEFTEAGIAQPTWMKKELNKVNANKVAGMVQPTWMKNELNKVNANKVLDFVGFGRTPEQWLKEYEENKHRMLEHYKEDSDVAQVFCIFECESAQNYCLKELTAGLLPSTFDIQTVKDEYLFRGKNQLLIAEAPEPYDVCWENIGTSTSIQILQQKLVCFFYLGCLNCACAVLVTYSFQNFWTFATTVLISCIDEVK